MKKTPRNKKSSTKKTRVQLQQEIDELKDKQRQEDEAVATQSRILDAWSRLDPDGTRY